MTNKMLSVIWYVILGFTVCVSFTDGVIEPSLTEASYTLIALGWLFFGTWMAIRLSKCPQEKK